jgi:hypothetical protein
MCHAAFRVSVYNARAVCTSLRISLRHGGLLKLFNQNQMTLHSRKHTCRKQHAFTSARVHAHREKHALCDAIESRHWN